MAAIAADLARYADRISNNVTGKPSGAFSGLQDKMHFFSIFSAK